MAQIWKVVGGADKGGIIVRDGVELTAPLLDDRASTGALLEEIEFVVNGGNERLHFKRLTGSGPSTGWVSTTIKGKTLVEKTDEKAPAAVPEPDTYPCALMFPGQGSQYVKMLSGVKDLPKVKDMLEKSKEILGYDILQICLEGPEEKLEETRYCQPALFIGGLAGVEKLRETKPDCATKPKFVAGLSLGEYTALCQAGVFSFEDGLKLVKLRGEAMQEAAQLGKQAMLSVAGLEKGVLEKLCEEAKKEEGGSGVCSIANALFPNGFSCGGTEKAINLLKDKAEKAGALQAKVLKTAGAFHTELMAPAQVKLNEALDEVFPSMKPPTVTIYMNATSEPIKVGGSTESIIANLKKQLTSSVLWEPSIKKMIDAGIKEYYECGPMKQLKAMMKRIDQTVWKTTTNVDV
mmetsp:Transcript_43898/g.77738  ORF Transcript_43898/g.77738 Transcript_43898/m.77738 type:complete len:406 (-) Transcript_43898:190-1407(-)